MSWLALNLAVLAINLCVLALSIKIYTEILKDGAQNRRAKPQDIPCTREAGHGGPCNPAW